MKKLIALTLIMVSFAAAALAATPAEIADAYRQNSAAALEQYGGQEMEFTGTVVSCKRLFNHKTKLWALQIDAGEIDAVGYVREAVPVGQEFTLHGTCSKIRNDSKVTVVLN